MESLDFYAAPSNRDTRGFENYMSYLEVLASLPEIRVRMVDPNDPVAELGQDLVLAASRFKGTACSLVISEDSRLLESIGQCQELGHRCGAAMPSGTFHKRFFEEAAFFKRVRVSMLKASLLPDEVTSARGSIVKPEGW